MWRVNVKQEVVRVCRDDDPPSHLVLALEHLTGGMLLDRLKKGPLAEHHAAAAFHQILTCILYMHHSGYLHRDLKPDNVMLAYDWDPERDAHVPPPVKLIDLGMVLNYVEQPNETGLMGSPGYMSPEAIRCAPPTGWEDPTDSHSQVLPGMKNTNFA